MKGNKGRGRSRGVCVNVTRVTIDGPGNRTPRPCPAFMRASMEAFREKLIRYGRLKLPDQHNGEQPSPDEKK